MRLDPSHPSPFALEGKEIILASGSETRAEILKKAGISAISFPVEVPEEAIKERNVAQKKTFEEIAQILAREKAQKASELFENHVGKLPVFIGADQVLECQNRLYSKPRSLEEAKKQLWTMRGQTQKLHSAVSLFHKGEEIWHYRESPTLKMRLFSEEMLDVFLAFEGESLLSCVGACKIEGPGIQLFETISGSQEAILGLPLLPLLAVLRKIKYLLT